MDNATLFLLRTLTKRSLRQLVSRGAVGRASLAGHTEVSRPERALTAAAPFAPHGKAQGTSLPDFHAQVATAARGRASRGAAAPIPVTPSCQEGHGPMHPAAPRHRSITPSALPPPRERPGASGTASAPVNAGQHPAPAPSPSTRCALDRLPSWNGQTPFCNFSLHYSLAFFN